MRAVLVGMLRALRHLHAPTATLGSSGKQIMENSHSPTKCEEPTLSQARRRLWHDHPLREP